MASVAADYLPILLFLAVALGLSGAFVLLPMIVARLTGAHKPYPDKLTEYECGFPAFEDSRAASSTCASTWSRSCSSSSTSRRRSCSPGRSASMFDLGWPGWITMMIFLVELGARPRLCVEEGSARMGVILDPRARDRAPADCSSPTPTFFNQPQRRGRRQGLPRHVDRGSVPVGAHRLAVVDDLRPRLLRGRDDPREHAALRLERFGAAPRAPARASRT